MKATAGVVNGKMVEIFKDPVTDDGLKKSARGLLCVDAGLVMKDQCSVAEASGGMLKTVFK
jgi:nicotinamide phosphoribosyltransferase